MIAAPPVRRRLVGKALRRHRETLGYTLDDTARMLGCDRSKVCRIETGARGIRCEDLARLLAEYGITGEQRAILADLADPRSTPAWHRDYADILPGAWQDYLTLEASASKIAAYEAQRIPELLQTPAYAYALAEADPALASAEARHRAVEAVIARQRAVLGRQRPDIRLIIGEAALCQRAGGPQVTEGQLGLLAGVAGDSGTITVQILPLGGGAHAAAGIGSMTILGFPGEAGLGIVHLGGARGGVCLEDSADLQAHDRLFGQLTASALSPAQSALQLRGMTAG